MQCKTSTALQPQLLWLPNHLKQHLAAVEEYREISAGVPGTDQSMLLCCAEPGLEKKTPALHNKMASMVKLWVSRIGCPKLPPITMHYIFTRLYDDTWKKAKAELLSGFKRGTTAAAFTIDMWTLCANKSYVSITCPFAKPTFQMERFPPNTRYMAASHSAGNMAELLGEKCNGWETPDKCHKYIVTDNGCNIRAEVRRLQWALLTPCSS
ncbi:hypothetical protein HPB48_019031 [Haemaphysalis longicornis]|uniref:Uncharacterized protein n=1 Tax=Haemaphysalis longicornis TaxID=44386 RepID=A0A9J6GK69_HAELO|nr:hypothetical protein HPB48_019031 [Haemaphysalis longicornis]